ncbi:MAG: VRR-NUC domain-containing protein [Candidatus Paceibacterota bacterium]
MKITKSKVVPTEYEEGVVVAEYLEFLKNKGKVLVYTKTAQETFTKSWGVKAKNKKSGVRPGLPDYIVIFSNGQLLFIELKRRSGGVLSEYQKEWISAINETNNKVIVARGASEAIDYINDVLSI